MPVLHIIFITESWDNMGFLDKLFKSHKTEPHQQIDSPTKTDTPKELEVQKKLTQMNSYHKLLKMLYLKTHLSMNIEMNLLIMLYIYFSVIMQELKNG